MVFLLVGLAGGASVWGQTEEALEKGPVFIEEIKFQQTSLNRNATQGSSADRMLSESWWQVWVKFSATPRPEDPNPGFVDEVTIKVYVDGVEDPEKEGYVVLTSEVTFINVPAGREHFATFYLYPTAANRYGGPGARGFRQSNVFAEALVGGQPVSKRMMKEIKGDDPEWYKKGRQINNLLIPFFESPWWPFEAGTYNQFKR
ncbi:MAG: hypothetical protein OHK005_16900 [Candidatus Methylacidiphilales bacterium]